MEPDELLDTVLAGKEFTEFRFVLSNKPLGLTTYTEVMDEEKLRKVWPKALSTPDIAHLEARREDEGWLII